MRCTADASCVDALMTGDILVTAVRTVQPFGLRHFLPDCAFGSHISRNIFMLFIPRCAVLRDCLEQS